MLSPRQLLSLGLLAVVAGAAPAAQERPRSLILFVGDGFGPAYAELARAVSGEALAMDAILVGGAITASANARVAESAAGATAYACGLSTRNGAVAVDAAGRPCRTLLEAARGRALRTGIVTTTRVTHATPAAFAAHHVDRDAEDDIAAQMAASGLDVLFGGGAGYFSPVALGGRRADEHDVIQSLSTSGYTVVTDPACFSTIDAVPAAALLAESHLAYEIDREETAEPSLAEMTTRAVALLAAEDHAFVLVVEGGRIDHAGHDNDPAATLHDVLAYDAAIAAALEWARTDGRVLVVGVSDHETGGLSLGQNDVYDWYPAALAAATESAGRMAERIEAGEDPATVLADGGGVDSLGAPDVVALAAAATDARDAIARILSERAGVAWTTTGHTAVDVGVYAFGPGAERFAGARPAAAVGRLLFEVMGLTGGE